MAVRRLYDEATGEYLDVDLPDENGQQLTNQEAGAVRKARADKEKAEADLAAQRKENAFLRVGLDLDKPVISDFYKAYDGDLSLDAIKAAATARGYLGQAEDGEQIPDSGSAGPAPTPPSPDLAAQHRANQAISSASAGATPDLRSDVTKLAEAHAAGGSAAVSDLLREAGYIVVTEGQT